MVVNPIPDAFIYIYMDPAILKRLRVTEEPVPVTRFALGVSIVDQGIKVHAIGDCY